MTEEQLTNLAIVLSRARTNFARDRMAVMNNESDGNKRRFTESRNFHLGVLEAIDAIGVRQDVERRTHSVKNR